MTSLTKLKGMYEVSTTLMGPCKITKIKHIFINQTTFQMPLTRPFMRHASPNSNITKTSLTGAYEGLSQQVKVS